MMRKFLLLMLTVLVVISCTENPFSNSDDNKIVKEKISGFVSLADGDTPEHILVWVKQFNIYEYTDENGKFSITIPLPENQSLDGPYSGNMDIYFYLDNYTLDSVTCELFNGEVAKEQDYWSTKRKMTKEISLRKIVDFKIHKVNGNESATSEFAHDLDHYTFKIRYIIQSLDRFQTVKSYKVPSDNYDSRYFKQNLTGVIFKPKNEKGKIVASRDEAYVPISYKLEPMSLYYFEFKVNIIGLDLKEEEYYVYPYFRVERKLPIDLQNALNKLTDFGETYALKFPLHQKIGKIKFE